ncbi:MAG: ABC transporter ATP-binding protein [Candidatus Gracilibacteria bacterium]|nr:ABC transporter ATP-binding protein [Candidatus Gracilibacteria bacterium]MDD4530602.1 ABC transporter ATP-binding protein [Candidatus Gracilibacteria bacterium]
MPNLIKLENIKKSYIVGDQTIDVLKGIDLEINEGEFISITGQSGSGKSTLMNIIGMLDNPTSGNYYFNNENVADITDDEQALIRRKNIGFIFQSYNLISRTSAIKQVMMPLIYQGVPGKERIKRATEALNKVGLGDKLNSLPNELSGGQQQRISIARALVTNPLIILGDEPTGALDSKTGEEIMELMMSLNNEGKTIIIITHSPEVDKYAKKRIYIKDGLILN